MNRKIEGIRVFCKKGVLEISQNSQENTCARVSFSIKPATSLKEKLWNRRFPVNIAKFLRIRFCIENIKRISA